MKTEYWVLIAVVALLVGLLIGYGIWGSKAGEVANLKAQVEQLSQENAQLKAGASTASTTGTTPTGVEATPAAATTETK